MIQYIRGELAVVEADRVIVDVGGVGYGIFMPVESISQLPPVGNEVRIYTYLNVKEDAMQLFGFLTRDDLQVFKLLIGVNGIGPKGGQAVLSVLSPDDLRFAEYEAQLAQMMQLIEQQKKVIEELRQAAPQPSDSSDPAPREPVVLRSSA